MSVCTGLSHTASINSLPVETLSKIFTNSSNNSSSGEDYRIILSARKNNSELFTTYPWNLRLVCKYWNEVVVSSPQLWTNFLLDVCSLPEKAYWINFTRAFQDIILRTPIVPSLRLCLLRSKNHLLRFSIKATNDYIQYLPTLLSLLLPHASRWEALDLDFPVDEFDLKHDDFMVHVNLLLLGTISFPQLRELKIKTKTKTVGRTGQRYLLMDGLFRKAPLLSKLQHSDNLRWLCVNFPVSHITDFTTIIDPCGQRTRYGSILCALPLMPALVNLTVVIQKCHATQQGFPSSPNIRTPSKPIPLRRLNLHIISPTRSNCVTSFLNHLSPSPALTHLKISQSSVLEFVLNSLESFFQRSQCTIKSLDLENATSEPLLKLIQMLPQLESLNLDRVYFNKTLLKELTFPSELDTAECNGRWINKMVIRNPVISGYGQAQLDRFVKMLESRLRLVDYAEELMGRLDFLYVVIPAGKNAQNKGRLVKLLTALRSSYKGNFFLSDH